jgi:hypothetical protein
MSQKRSCIPAASAAAAACHARGCFERTGKCRKQTWTARSRSRSSTYAHQGHSKSA